MCQELATEPANIGFSMAGRLSVVVVVVIVVGVVAVAFDV